MKMLGEFWWQQDKGSEHSQVFETVKALDNRQGGTRSALRDHLGLYLDREVHDFVESVRSRSVGLFGESRHLNLNVIKSCIDTVSSKIVSQRPRPLFLTTAGRFEDRQKAKKLERWTDGLFYREKVYSIHAPRVFHDACVFGTGALKIFQDPFVNEVRLERVWIGELLVDELSSLYADPRVLFQRKQIPRSVLVAGYPEFEKEIMELDPAGEDYAQDVVVDTIVEAIESWHLPSGPKAKDGRHCICINNVTLLSEEYKEPEFPFVFFRWSKSPVGFHGVGLAEELHGIQVEIKTLLEKIKAAMELTATVWILKPRSTRIPDEHFSNRMGTIIEYDGPQPPRVETPASMNSQVFDHLWQLYQRAYEISGISQLSASSKRPEGVESGVAMRTLLDVETQRFALVARDWEEFFIEVVRRSICCAKRTYKGSGGKIKFPKKNVAEEIVWSDVNLDEDSYVLRAYPTNILPSTPAGKLATVEQMLQMQMMTPAEGKALLDFPDLDKFMDLTNAAREDVEAVLEQILYEGVYEPPTPEMYLEVGVPLSAHYWALGRREGAPKERLAMLTQWGLDAADMMRQAAPPPVPGIPGAPGGEAIGMPNESMPPGMPGAGMGGMPPMGGLPPDLASLPPA